MSVIQYLQSFYSYSCMVILRPWQHWIRLVCTYDLCMWGIFITQLLSTQQCSYGCQYGVMYNVYHEFNVNVQCIVYTTEISVAVHPRCLIDKVTGNWMVLACPTECWNITFDAVTHSPVSRNSSMSLLFSQIAMSDEIRCTLSSLSDSI